MGKSKNIEFDLSPEELDLLNSRKGLKQLFSNGRIDLESALNQIQINDRLEKLHRKMVQLQLWTIENNKKIILLFEGRDTAGKGSAIRKASSKINPRHFRSVFLSTPIEEEIGEWYFQRYVEKLPKPGEIVFMNRGLYSRGIVEPMIIICSKEQYRTFMRQVNEFEKMLLDGDTHLLKFFFTISKKEQASRLKKIKSDPLKQWKINSIADPNQEYWDEFTKYQEKLLEKTNHEAAPWILVDATNKDLSRIRVMEEIVKQISFNESA